MVALEIFFRVFFNKLKLHNLIKKILYIDDNNNNNKKTRKYIKFTIAFYMVFFIKYLSIILAKK